MVNLDMVGRLRTSNKTNKDVLLVEGTGTAKTFDKLVADLAAQEGYDVKKTPGASPFSDHDSFYKKKIPVVFYWTDKHDDYHKPSDTSDLINVAGMRRVTDLAEKTVVHLATTPERPEYVYVPGQFKFVGGKMPRLGIAPTYEAGITGLLVGGVSDGGPAAKAGLQKGDVIIELAGRQVTSIDTYMVIMRRQRAGRPLDVVVRRGSEKLSFKVTPQ
jgi:C-terminal processing protease CtpA/Prc